MLDKLQLALTEREYFSASDLQSDTFDPSFNCLILLFLMLIYIKAKIFCFGKLINFLMIDVDFS